MTNAVDEPVLGKNGTVTDLERHSASQKYRTRTEGGGVKKNITRYVYITHYLRQLFMYTLINFDFCPTVSNRSTMEYVN